ncbi:MAG: hypothetical protein GY906_06000 [bacterium]|nr:hypothetical protein [bacterium]
MNLKAALKKLIVGGEQQPPPDLGRNDICWCGSQRKYKQCHMSSDNQRRSAARATGPKGASGKIF